MPTVETVCGRLLRKYDAADTDTLLAGINWYPRATAICQHLADGSGFSLEQVTAIMAVLSPRLHWSDNVRDTELVIDVATDPEASYPVFRALGANVEKAWLICNGASPESVVSGPKVEQFWRNLQGDQDALTLDEHAVSAAGMSFSGNSGYLRVKDRATLQKAYARAARKRDVSTAVMQATVWIVQRGAAN